MTVLTMKRILFSFLSVQRFSRMFKIFSFQSLQNNIKNFSNTTSDYSKKISDDESKKVSDGNINFPIPPNENDCCGSGCANCVWLKYVTEVEFYYKNNNVKLQEAINMIPSGFVREFVKTELKHLMSK